MMMRFLKVFVFLLLGFPALCQVTGNWNHSGLFNTYRLELAPGKPEYIDLDGDGDPDVLRSVTMSGIPIQWIDDDDDMADGDIQGDMDSDCLMVDRNKDGNYGHYSDVVIDWVDNDSDGNADMQIYAEYADEKDKDIPVGPGHLMINIDLDKDGIMNNIDLNTFQLRCWQHEGQSDFFQNYHGKSLFLKIHTSPEKINDPRLNWENPFLFYDPDSDGLTECAIRVIDRPVRGIPGDEYLARMTGNVTWISMSYDLDNDNGPGNEFDLDMTINFRGKGFNYMDQVHEYPDMRGLSASDQYFMDPRIRQQTELIYPDHDSIINLVFQRGKWDEVYFVYDEDDDCNRWERVELYEPNDPYVTGKRNGGLDNNPQSDVVGDRGEWDLDNSGGGNLYIGRLDGKIHLYGAETGYWRIDQNSYYCQGMGGLYDGYGPSRLSKDADSPFPVVKYTDTDNNGFFDKVEYDLDGDRIYEETYSLLNLEIDDQWTILKTGEMNYAELSALETKVANNMWKQAVDACNVAQENGINLKWYALLMHPKSIRQKYDMGYWLQFYLFRDLLSKANYEQDQQKALKIIKAYHSSGWHLLSGNL